MKNGISINGLMWTLIILGIMVYGIYDNFVFFRNRQISKKLNKSFVKYKLNRKAVVRSVNYKGRNNVELILFDYGLLYEVKCTINDLEF